MICKIVDMTFFLNKRYKFKFCFQYMYTLPKILIVFNRFNFIQFYLLRDDFIK